MATNETSRRLKLSFRASYEPVNFPLWLANVPWMPPRYPAGLISSPLSGRAGVSFKRGPPLLF